MGSDSNQPGSHESLDREDPNRTHDGHDETTVRESADPNRTVESIDQLPDSGQDRDKTIEAKPFGVQPESDFESVPKQDNTDDELSVVELAKLERAKKTVGQSEANEPSAHDTMRVDSKPGAQELSFVKPKDRIPEFIGRYEIIRLLGEGTFGKVYQARDPQLDRIVAVKVAKSISGPTQVKRFLREARAAAKLRHPNIIPVYEYGRIDGENIIVYEFVEGETLKSYLRRQKNIPLSESVEIVRGIADGLDYAHEQGIIHRDMKPDNVLLDPRGRPHIADFGCARSIDDKTSLTIDGSILGTPIYMSPEQAGGKSNLADRRTDIWSLGVMLYEMASGKKPFDGQLSDLLFWICNKDPIPIRKIRPDIPLDIETICSKCLTREIDKRFATAKLLADELGRFQRGEPIHSRRITLVNRTWMWAKRNQTVASLMAVVAITLLVGTVVSSTFAIQAFREKRIRAFAQMDAITTSESNALPGIYESLVPFRATILPRLKQRRDESQPNSESQHRLQMAILKLELDSHVKQQIADEMVDDLLVADPGVFYVTREILEFRKNELKEVLWNSAIDLSESSSSGQRFRAAAALALYDHDSPRWNEIAPDVAKYLTSINEIEMSLWLPSLQPIRTALQPTLKAAYLDRESDSDATPRRAAAILSRLFINDVEFLVGLIPDATPQQIPYLIESLKLNRAESVTRIREVQERETLLNSPTTTSAVMKSNLVTSLIQLNDQTQWNRFSSKEDMSVVTELVERIGPASTPFDLMSAQINNWRVLEADVLSGVLLALGQYRQNQILDEQKNKLQPLLLSIFSEHPDARVHSCSRWLWQKWEFNNDIWKREFKLRRAHPDPDKNWHVDLAGNTFALFGPVSHFEMGLNDQLASGSELLVSSIFDEPRHTKVIPRRFGICIHEVTIKQFEEFEDDLVNRYRFQLANVDNQIESSLSPEDSRQVPPPTESEKTPLEILQVKRKRIQSWVKAIERGQLRRADIDTNSPVGNVDFFKAVGYCRWLSEQQGTECGLPKLDELQRFYDQRRDFRITQNHLERLGYRLPTAAEWEFSCRGQSETLFPFGRSVARAGHYAWFATNSNAIIHPVGQLKPGNTGLFDVLGNVNEWCLDWYLEKLPKIPGGEQPGTYVDAGPEYDEHRSLFREHRGGSFKHEVLDVRSTKRFSMSPYQGHPYLGFRLARTYDASGGEKKDVNEKD